MQEREANYPSALHGLTSLADMDSYYEELQKTGQDAATIAEISSIFDGQAVKFPTVCLLSL